MLSTTTEHPRQSLSFVEGVGRDLNYWAVPRTGVWSEDVNMGRGIAAEVANHICENDDPLIMEKVTHAICKVEEMGGVEIGFLHRVGEMMARTAL